VNNIKESSLTRVWKYINDEEHAVVILTAFTDGVDEEVAISKNKLFASEIKSAGFGYFYLDGYFSKKGETDDEVQVKEDSIFAIAEVHDGQKLIDICHELANSENQDRIIVKNKLGEIYFLEKNGNKVPFGGKLIQGELGKYYTKLRNKKETNSFFFENERNGKGFIESYRECLKSQSKLSRDDNKD
jgi:hypothetical protein